MLVPLVMPPGLLNLSRSQKQWATVAMLSREDLRTERDGHIKYRARYATMIGFT